MRNLAVSTLIELPNTTIRMETSLFFLFCVFTLESWLAGLCWGKFLQSMTLQIDYVDLKAATTVPESKTRWVANVQTVIFGVGVKTPFMSPGCNPLEGVCWSSRQANVIVSFRGIFPTFVLISLLFFLHLRPPRWLYIHRQLVLYWQQLPKSHTLPLSHKFSGPGACCT